MNISNNLMRRRLDLRGSQARLLPVAFRQQNAG